MAVTGEAVVPPDLDRGGGQGIDDTHRRSARMAWAHACQLAGGGLAAWMAGDYVLAPRWPTPDLLLLFAAACFMSAGQAWDLVKRLAPFSVLLLVYQSFRGIVPHLNHRVNYDLMIGADRKLFGSEQLPTAYLQHLLWQGTPSWYDYLFYVVYMLHFVAPVFVVIMAWKFRPHLYGFVIRCYVALTAAGFITYLLFPAAPPWLAADEGFIPSLVRISDSVYSEMGLASSTTLWSQISPNPVAAVPSLHAAYATLFAILIWAMFGSRWAVPALAYPAIIYVGTVYAGEHYVIDEVLGFAYAVAVVIAVKLRGRLRIPGVASTEHREATAPMDGSVDELTVPG